MMKRCLAVLIPALLSACAAAGTYPSLAKRPFEKPPATPPETPVAPAMPSDAALLGRIADALKQARDGVPDFEAALPAARMAAERASGATQESDAWIQGQVMVTRLERTTGPARDALVALDDERRFLDQRPGSPDIPVLQSAIAEVEAIDARQSEAIRALLALLK
jgi:hypothetical protein